MGHQEAGKGSEGFKRQGETSPKVELDSLVDKRIALHRLRVVQMRKAWRRVTERVEATPEVDGSLYDLVATSRAEGEARVDAFWTNAVEVVTGDDGRLTDISGIDIVRMRNQAEELSENAAVEEEFPRGVSPALPEDEAVQPLSEDILKPGDPVDEIEVRMTELYAIEETARGEGKKLTSELGDELEETPVADKVDRVINHAIAWGEASEQQRWVAALLEHPDIPVETAIEIWDAANAQRTE